MARSGLREIVASVAGREKHEGHRSEPPMELALERDGNGPTAVLSVKVQYPVRRNRMIEIPLSTEQLRRLRDLADSILDE